MMNKLSLAPCFLVAMLTGCSTQEMLDWNQKVSDFGSQVSKTMTGGKQDRSDKTTNVTIPVDIDTAASRLRRYYGFSDVNTKIATLQQSGRENDKWVAQAITEEGHTFEATPGSYYKFGRKLGKDEPRDEVIVELEKNGTGTLMYITYHSSFSTHLTDDYVNPLFSQMRDVASGKIR
ncbi:hypothetical protein [Providencia rettgeri]|uniref:hypothetical protein n=1 Tax=Providencia rettgeri TaxID=587 RepID=UPI0024AB1D52